jgi:serine/threonine protein kinase
MAGFRDGLRSLGAGPDGASFAGTDHAGRAVVVLRIRGEVLAHGSRRRRLQHTIALHEAAAREGQSGFVHLFAQHLDRNPAVLVLERAPRTLVAVAPWQTVDDCIAGLRALLDVARTLAQLHGEGLAHGQLARGAVWLRDDGSAALVTLGIATGLVAGDDDAGVLAHPADEPASLAADLYALGWVGTAAAWGATAARALLAATPGRREPPTSTTNKIVDALQAAVLQLALALRVDEPAWRPPIGEVVARLGALLDAARRGELPAATVSEGERAAPDGADDGGDDAHDGADGDTPRRLGRFTVDALLGSGAMGRVFRGTDVVDGTPVAIKVLAREGPITKKAMQRFRKEARLLSEIRSPGVARFLGDGVDGERLYLVTEFVDGEPLSARIAASAPLPERQAVDLTLDVLRALADVHAHGIVHRDLKPDNIMVVGGAGAVGSIKLIDFGIARHVDEVGSLAMTRRGAVLGTPLYMAPEQVRGGLVDQRTDLYAVGTVLFELLAGRPPFGGLGVSLVLAAQLEKIPPRVDEIRPAVAAALAAVVARCLEKDPGARYDDAASLIAALAPFSSDAARSAPTVPVRPQTPTQRWSSSWVLRSTPEELWPYVADTNRINHAIGLGPVQAEQLPDGDGLRQRGRSTQAGLRLAWIEHPFEWVYARRLAVHREYEEGPLRSMRSCVELFPAETGRGTRLVHTIELEPRGLLGRAMASVEVGLRTRRALDQVYERIDALVRAGGVDDAFEAAVGLPTAVEARFVELERNIIAAGAPASVVARVGEWLRRAPPQEVARIRPLALARRLGLDQDAVVDVGLHGARQGLFVLLWDVLCPSCRVPSSMTTTLQALREHGRCEVCNLDWTLDLSTGIELVFRIHPSLRTAEPGTFCLSSPGHTPHVVAQLRVPRSAKVPLQVGLPPGSYRLTGRRLTWRTDFVVRAGAPGGTWRVALATGPTDDLGRRFGPERQDFEFVNDTDREQLVRIERATPREDVLTGASALARPLFRRLFPEETIAPGTMLRAGDVTVLLAALRDDGNDLALEQRFAAFRALDAALGGAGGVVVKLHGTDAVLATFASPRAALRAAVALPRAADVPRDRLVVGVHRGVAGAVTLGDRLDYFGAAIDAVVDLVQHGRPRELVVADDLRADAVQDGIRFDGGEAAPGVGNTGATTDDSAVTFDDLVHRALLVADERPRG